MSAIAAARINGIRAWVWDIMDGQGVPSRAEKCFQIFILSLIGLNVLAVCLETVKPLHEAWECGFEIFDVASVGIFSIEYVVRFWAAPSHSEYAGWKGRFRYFLSPLSVIDLLAVVPFYLPFFGMDLRVVRAFRFLRILRAAKLGRYSRAVRTLGRVIAAKRDELIATFLIVMLLLIVASSLMFFIEHDAQPEKFSSIPETMWWAVATLTTVGYGDVYPVTTLGKALAAVIAILGIGLFALPTGILGAGFVEEMQADRRKKRKCPSCGAEFGDDE
jgi:voltage-gated potassium channel